MSEQRVREGWVGYCQSCRSLGLTPLGAVVSRERKVVYCQTEADSADQVRAAHAGVAIPLEDVLEVLALPAA